jgi:hypothetical protein
VVEHPIHATPKRMTNTKAITDFLQNIFRPIIFLPLYEMIENFYHSAARKARENKKNPLGAGTMVHRSLY